MFLMGISSMLDYILYNQEAEYKLKIYQILAYALRRRNVVLEWYYAKPGPRKNDDSVTCQFRIHQYMYLILFKNLSNVRDFYRTKVFVNVNYFRKMLL